MPNCTAYVGPIGLGEARHAHFIVRRKQAEVWPLLQYSLLRRLSTLFRGVCPSFKTHLGTPEEMRRCHPGPPFLLRHPENLPGGSTGPGLDSPPPSIRAGLPSREPACETAAARRKPWQPAILAIPATKAKLACRLGPPP
ncbi:uncharacterized protein LOC144010581 [Festucalex cinctus]